MNKTNVVDSIRRRKRRGQNKKTKEKKKKMRSSVNTNPHPRGHGHFHHQENDEGVDHEEDEHHRRSTLFTNEEDQKWCCGWFAMFVVYTGVKCLQGLNFIFCTIPATIYNQIRRCCSRNNTPKSEQARVEFRTKWTQAIVRAKAELNHSNFERAELIFRHVLENVQGKDHDLEGDAYLGIANSYLKMNQVGNAGEAYEQAALAYAAGEAFGNAEFCAEEAARVRNQDLKNNLLSQEIRMRFEAYNQRIHAQQQQQQDELQQDGLTTPSPSSSSLQRHLVQDEHHQLSQV